MCMHVQPTQVIFDDHDEIKRNEYIIHTIAKTVKFEGTMAPPNAPDSAPPCYTKDRFSFRLSKVLDSVSAIQKEDSLAC